MLLTAHIQAPQPTDVLCHNLSQHMTLIASYSRFVRTKISQFNVCGSVRLGNICFIQIQLDVKYSFSKKGKRILYIQLDLNKSQVRQYVLRWRR
jgi:hypothetical protein